MLDHSDIMIEKLWKFYQKYTITCLDNIIKYELEQACISYIWLLDEDPDRPWHHHPWDHDFVKWLNIALEYHLILEGVKC